MLIKSGILIEVSLLSHILKTFVALKFYNASLLPEFASQVWWLVK